MASNNFLECMTGNTYSKAKFDKAILAVGSTENHGGHLPFGTDTLVSYEIAKEVASRIKGLLVLPALPYGMSDHYSSFPIAISLRSETLVEMLKDVLTSLWKHSLRRVIIVNGHDGNIAPIETAAREFKVSHPQIKIAVLEAWWITAGKLLPKGTFEVWDGLGHAGEGETSMILALKPELVDMEHARGVVPALPEEVSLKWTFDELTSYGATGDPTKATREKGKKMKQVLVNYLVDFVKKMDEADWKYGVKKV